MSKESARNPDLVPDRKWKQWTYENLPASDCNWITDIDSLIRTRGGCVALIEIKRQGAEVAKWQRTSYGILDAALRLAEGETLESKLLPFPITITSYKGVYEIIFENTWFDDGKVFYTAGGSEKIETTEEQLVKILNFDLCLICYPKDKCSCH